MSDPVAPSSLPPEPNPAPAPGAPPIPSQPAGADSASPASATSGTGLPPNIAAMLASLLSIVGGIVFLILEKKDQFVRFYAMQSTILGGLWIVVGIVLGIIAGILGSFLGLFIVLVAKLIYLAFLFLTLLLAFKAFTGKEWEIPYIGKIAREQLAKMPTAS